MSFSKLKLSKAEWYTNLETDLICSVPSSTRRLYSPATTRKLPAEALLYTQYYWLYLKNCFHMKI